MDWTKVVFGTVLGAGVCSAVNNVFKRCLLTYYEIIYVCLTLRLYSYM
eukprot:COSAG01_NODE_5787_length_4034_cov_2.053875_4_plen_48_part_00